MLRNTNLILFLISLLLVSNSHAYNSLALSAYSLSEVLSEVNRYNFHLIEKGKLDGYNITRACLYSNGELGDKNLLILKHYCGEKRRSAPRSYTIISKKLGIINLYEEYTTTLHEREYISFYKRTFGIEQFPEIYSANIRKQPNSISGVNKVYRYFKQMNTPLCFATNGSNYKPISAAQCLNTNIDFSLWLDNSIAIVRSDMYKPNPSGHWQKALELLRSKMQPSLKTEQPPPSAGEKKR